jgi:hypothetical protein
MAFKIDSQLNENQIESDVSSYLGFITPIWARRFRLISVDEQLTGADKLFNRFVPIYIQFKVSYGLDPNSSILNRFLNKPLTNIISYRNKNNLSGNPILYFQLRRQAKTATDLQHNILFNLNKPPLQFGLYVAPLTLELTEYESQLSGDWFMKFYPFDPFIQRDLEIHDTFTQRNIAVGMNPFLRHHIAIPPHTSVTTHNHHYSFSKSGGDVAWHGGELLYGDFRLSAQFLRIMNYSYNRDGFGLTQNQYSDFIDNINREFRIGEYSRFNDNSIREKISNFGIDLKEKFQINLMFLTETKG